MIFCYSDFVIHSSFGVSSFAILVASNQM
jgi:hypothetical protein